MRIRGTDFIGNSSRQLLKSTDIPVNSEPSNSSQAERRALKFIGAEPRTRSTNREKLRISRILSPNERLMLPDIWDETQPVTVFDSNKRFALAQFFRAVANRAPKGSAQWGFNIARARFFEGKGPTPGRSAVDYAQREGLPVARWPRGSRRHANDTMNLSIPRPQKSWQLRASL